ncbi:MAG: MBL fold metallo-hydrolase [Clostridia bacterium]|nr:MBL fold metallo-hydrolase [Clostridia bacterium]
MQLSFAPLFSGSSGNATLVKNDQGAILIDAGVTAKRLAEALPAVGCSIDDVRAILVTHEHFDHIKGLPVLSRRYKIPIYATEGTLDALTGDFASPMIRVAAGEAFSLCGMEITPFRTPHDAAESCGYVVEYGIAKFALATDIGSLKSDWFDRVVGADAVLLESNYDDGMLTAGSYPWPLKQRIRGTRGHLPNEIAGVAAARLVESGTKTVVLGHLSKENNHPEVAKMTVRAVLMENGIDPDRDLLLDVAKRDTPTALYTINAGFTR